MMTFDKFGNIDIGTTLKTVCYISNLPSEDLSSRRRRCILYKDVQSSLKIVKLTNSKQY